MIIRWRLRSGGSTVTLKLMKRKLKKHVKGDSPAQTSEPGDKIGGDPVCVL